MPLLQAHNFAFEYNRCNSLKEAFGKRYGKDVYTAVGGARLLSVRAEGRVAGACFLQECVTEQRASC